MTKTKGPKGSPAQRAVELFLGGRSINTTLSEMRIEGWISLLPFNLGGRLLRTEVEDYIRLELKIRGQRLQEMREAKKP